MRTSINIIEADIKRCEAQIKACKQQHLPAAKTIIKGFEITYKRLLAERQSIINRIEVINPIIVSA